LPFNPPVFFFLTTFFLTFFGGIFDCSHATTNVQTNQGHTESKVVQLSISAKALRGALPTNNPAHSPRFRHHRSTATPINIH
jgi:hypothetical protein